MIGIVFWTTILVMVVFVICDVVYQIGGKWGDDT